MNLNPNSNNSGMNSVEHGAQRMTKAMGLGALGGAAAASFGTRVPFAPHQASPRKMPTENNPFKNAFRDSLRKLSPEAAREILMQRRESLGGLLGGLLGSAAK